MIMRSFHNTLSRDQSWNRDFTIICELLDSIQIRLSLSRKEHEIFLINLRKGK